MWPPCPPKPCPQYLPITTGRVGLSQGTGQVEFYGHTYRGTGIGLFYSKCVSWAPPCPPWWGASGGCGSGGFGSALAAVLTGANWCTTPVPPCPPPPTVSP